MGDSFVRPKWQIGKVMPHDANMGLIMSHVHDKNAWSLDQNASNN